MKAVGLLLIATTILAQAPENSSPLSDDDERGVYRLFLESFAGKSTSLILLEPLDPGHFVDRQCLKGLHLQKRKGPRLQFDESLIRGLPLTRSDQQKATLKLSTIEFDREHRYAALGYLFTCGPRCAQISMVVFEKSNGTWRQIDRHCRKAFA
jgi:hypothetical protein